MASVPLTSIFSQVVVRGVSSVVVEIQYLSFCFLNALVGSCSFSFLKRGAAEDDVTLPGPTSHPFIPLRAC